MTKNQLKAFEESANSAPHKAFALSEHGRFGWRCGRRSIEEARTGAITYCEKNQKTHCKIIAIDDTMIEE